MAMAKRGIYISHNVTLHDHERSTINFLLQKGYSVELVRPTNICRKPDILLNGVQYEIKSPLGDTKWTISRNLNKGRGQSNRIIIDLRRCKRSDEKCLREIRNYLAESRSVIEIIAITKDCRQIVYSK